MSANSKLSAGEFGGINLKFYSPMPWIQDHSLRSNKCNGFKVIGLDEVDLNAIDLDVVECNGFESNGNALSI